MIALLLLAAGPFPPAWADARALTADVAVDGQRTTLRLRRAGPFEGPRGLEPLTLLLEPDLERRFAVRVLKTAPRRAGPPPKAPAATHKSGVASGLLAEGLRIVELTPREPGPRVTVYLDPDTSIPRHARILDGDGERRVTFMRLAVEP